MSKKDPFHNLLWDAVRNLDKERAGNNPRPVDKRVAERRAHRFSDSIGGDSSNYVEPKFGPRREQ